MFDFNTQVQAIETAEAIMAQLLQSNHFKKAQKDEKQKNTNIISLLLKFEQMPTSNKTILAN
jgi:hypothetical protein